MILLCGIPSEPPVRLVWERLSESGYPCLMLNQRRALGTRIDLDAGTLHLGDRRHDLDAMTGVLLRPMDPRHLPELEDEPADGPTHRHAALLHHDLLSWCDNTPARVVNRPRAMASNGSKPYQAQRIRRSGLAVPETLVTNDPDAVRAFAEEHGSVVYKSASGVRSIVRRLEDEDVERLDRIRWCPTLFQAYIPGTDVRVHVAGHDVHATEVRSDATDYRYASREGAEVTMRATDIPDDIREACLRTAGDLELPLAGIDLRRTPDGDWVCFEVNPSPAFSYYEGWTGQPIAASVARYLAGAP